MEKRPPIEKIREAATEQRTRMRKLERERLYAELAKAPEKKRKRFIGGTLLLASALTGAWWYFNHGEELEGDEAGDVKKQDAGKSSLGAISRKSTISATTRREFQERLRLLLAQVDPELNKTTPDGGVESPTTEKNEIDDPGIAHEQKAYKSWLNERSKLLEELEVELANLLHDDWTTMDATDWQALIDWARDVEERRNILNASPFSLSPDVPFLPAIDALSYYGLDYVHEAIEEKQFEVAYRQLLSLQNQIATDKISMRYVLGET